jgi:hypothetical protein
MRCSKGTTDCAVAHDRDERWLCDAGDNNPYVGWLSPGDLEPGDALGYVAADGQFTPGAAVVAVAPVPGTEMWNITTHSGSLVLHGTADVFAFAGAAR